MTTTLAMPSASELLPLLPELVLIDGAFALLIVDLFIEARHNASGRAWPAQRASGHDGFDMIRPVVTVYRRGGGNGSRSEPVQNQFTACLRPM